jgi:hypothetical protein
MGRRRDYSSSNVNASSGVEESSEKQEQVNASKGSNATEKRTFTETPADKEPNAIAAEKPNTT